MKTTKRLCAGKLVQRMAQDFNAVMLDQIAQSAALRVELLRQHARTADERSAITAFLKLQEAAEQIIAYQKEPTNA
jgi:hypothetical protein